MDDIKITDVSYDGYSMGGCPTCNYNARYVDDITICYSDGVSIRFNCDLYIEIMSEADWMILLGNASSREDIISKWLEKVNKELDKDEYSDGEDVYYVVTKNGVREKYNIGGELINE